MQFTFEQIASDNTTTKRLLDRFGVSHRLFSKIVAEKRLKVNGQVVANVELRAGQRVVFTLPDEGAPLQQSGGPLTVVLETANWLIVNKPVGLTSVPGPTNPDDSLVNRVAGYLAGTGLTNPHPAVITRLDRDTSGLVLIAKHQFAQGRLDRIGIAHAVTKHYFALATGTMAEEMGTIRAPLAKSADGIHQEVSLDGKDAWTTYQVVARGTQSTLLRCHLLTGRTHQIRVHMASVGHPLVGDALYGGATTSLQAQALQASELSFTDPFTGEELTAFLPAPAQWHKMLN